jgi:hypothetical protein
MNIEEIIYSCNNEYYNIYSFVIKKYLLNLIINNKLTNKYEECINYFISINDINFKDSLEDISIAKILYYSLNNHDTFTNKIFHKNKIIILDSLQMFNKSISCLNEINYSLENINLNFKFIFNFSNFDISYIDNIYYDLTGYNNLIFTKIYNKIESIKMKQTIEIKKRLKEILLIIKKIYKLVLNDNNIQNISEINRETLISSLQIISIIKFKLKDSILNNDTIKELLSVFNQEIKQDSLSDSEYEIQKNNILSVLLTYDKIYDEYECVNPVEFIEKLFLESDNLNEILLEINLLNINELFINFANEMKTFIELNEQIMEDEINILKEFIRLSIDILIKINELYPNDFNDFVNYSYYENLYKIQFINFKKRQLEITYNNLIKLNKELKEIPESKMSDISKISKEVEKEIEKNFKLINNYNSEIENILKYTNSQSDEDEKLDDDIIKINKNIDELIYFFNEKDSELKIDRKDIIELLVKVGISYNRIEFNNITDIFEEKEIFLKFINSLSIQKKKIEDIKNVKLFLLLFNYTNNDTYDEYIKKILENGLIIYHNNFTLNKYEVELIINKIGFFIHDLITDLINS